MTEPYVGRLGSVIRGVKMMSVSSCLVTSGAAPLLVMTQANPSPVVLATAATFAVFGVFTTSLVTWTTSPYVISMRFDAAAKRFSIDTFTLTGRTRTTLIDESQIEKKSQSQRVQSSMRPFVTFGADKRLFFVHADDVPQAWKDKLL